MSHNISRRDWLKLIGGSAAGFILSPIPWKMLDESAKWSQSPSYPEAALEAVNANPRGRIGYKYTTCSLCPMSCGVRVRRAGNTPVGLSGIAGHPVSAGSLCAMGLAGHLLRYHPARLLHPVRREAHARESRYIPISIESAVSEIAERIASTAGGTTTVLDLQPERTTSHVYRKFLAGLNGGTYVVSPGSDDLPGELTSAVLNTHDTRFGFDVGETRTLLSFGTPVLDGWATQGQFAAITRARREAGDRKLKVIQVEAAYSRTAQLADEWIPVRPGAEALFALGIAHVLIEEKLCNASELRRCSPDFNGPTGRSFVDFVKGFPPERVSQKAGIAAERIITTARDLATRKPSLAVFGGNPASGPFGFAEQIIFMDLNILLGSIGTKGGIVPRRHLPGPFDRKPIRQSNKMFAHETYLAHVPDDSVNVLIIDGADSGSALPWSAIERKLVQGRSTVVSLSSHLSGFAAHADYVIPSPAHLEAAGDMPTPPGASFATYAICASISHPPKGTIHPIDFVNSLESKILPSAYRRSGEKSHGQLIRDRIDNIYAHRVGRVFDPAKGRSVDLSSIRHESFLAALGGGGCWFDDVDFNFRPDTYSFLGGEKCGFDTLSKTVVHPENNGSLIILPMGTRGAGSIAQENPMMAKLYVESDARYRAGTVRINPSTATRYGLRDGFPARIETDRGSITAKIRLDPAVMPDMLVASVAPSFYEGERKNGHDVGNILDICAVSGESTWRLTEAKIHPADGFGFSNDKS